MHALPKLLAVLALASVALAGCASGGGKATPDDVVSDKDFDGLGLKADSDTGILRGVVIDDAIRPIAGALVTLIVSPESNKTMTTKEDGVFGFDQLAPGEYFLQVTKAGFVSVQSSGRVEVGVANPDPVKVQMLADKSSLPYVESHHLDGYIQCSVRAMVIAEQCGVTDADVVNEDDDLVARPAWIQSEMIWTSTQAFGDELSLAIRCYADSDPAGKCADGQQTVIRSEGKNPQVARINGTLIEQWALGGPGGDPLHISLFAFGRSDLDAFDEPTIYAAQEPVTGDPCLYWPDQGILFGSHTCMRATGPGVIVNQKVDVYTHVFYGFLPPEDWSFGATGEVPTPP